VGGCRGRLGIGIGIGSGHAVAVVVHHHPTRVDGDGSESEESVSMWPGLRSRWTPRSNVPFALVYVANGFYIINK
jgi:hypothetical protein